MIALANADAKTDEFVKTLYRDPASQGLLCEAQGRRQIQEGDLPLLTRYVAREVYRTLVDPGEEAFRRAA
jgi:hypothetical protein